MRAKSTTIGEGPKKSRPLKKKPQGPKEKTQGQIINIRPRGQITLSAAIRRAVHLEEGDPVSVELTPEGILLRPMKLIDASQAWFWTEQWQRGEREAEEDIEKGRTKEYQSPEEFLESLDDQVEG